MWENYAHLRGGGGGGGRGDLPDFGYVCTQAEPNSRPLTLVKFSLKTYENDTNLLIFLHLMPKFQMLLYSRAKCPNFSYFY